MGPIKLPIAVGFGVLFLMATINRASATSAGWSEEFRATFLSGCNQNLVQGVDLSKSDPKILERTCQCITDGYSRTVPAEIVAILQDLTPEELESMPEYEPAKDVVPQCFQEFGLLAIIDAEKMKALPKDMREPLLEICESEIGEEVEGLENGREKLSNVCNCLADRFLPNSKNYVNEEEFNAAADAQLIECRKIYLKDE